MGLGAITSKLAASYFGVVFAAGFALGVIRTLWLVPALGERNAELLELPLMVIIYTAVAFHLVRRWEARLTVKRAIVAGASALLILLAFEFSVVLYLRGLTLNEYLESKDWLSGSAYLLSLLVFGAMPAFVYLKDSGNDR
jgi:hypothetical protein